MELRVVVVPPIPRLIEFTLVPCGIAEEIDADDGAVDGA